MARPYIACLLVAAAVVQTGCVSVFPKSPPAQLYRFGDDEAPAVESSEPAPSQAGSKVRVVVEGVDFPHASTADGILTVEGDKTAYISGARWVSPARILFQEALERRLQRSTRLSLASLGDPGPPALLLRVRVTAFETEMTSSGPLVRIALHVSLAQALGGEIQTQEIAAAAPASSATQTAIVAAYDRASDEALGKLVSWGGEAAGRFSPPAAAAPRVITRTTSSSSSTSTSLPALSTP